jgi:hypothetical protein
MKMLWKNGVRKGRWGLRGQQWAAILNKRVREDLMEKATADLSLILQADEGLRTAMTEETVSQAAVQGEPR